MSSPQAKEENCKVNLQIIQDNQKTTVYLQTEFNYLYTNGNKKQQQKTRIQLLPKTSEQVDELEIFNDNISQKRSH